MSRQAGTEMTPAIPRPSVSQEAIDGLAAALGRVLAELSARVTQRAAGADEDPALDRTWLSVKGVADYLEVSADFVYDAINRGWLRHTRIGGGRDIRVLRRWVDEWLSSGARQEARPRRRRAPRRRPSDSSSAGALPGDHRGIAHESTRGSQDDGNGRPQPEVPGRD